MSGGIAYYADLLGKKIGKKRLRYKNLRPKHVASLGTIGLGMMVSTLSIAVVMAFSENMRTVLVRGTGLIREIDERKSELSKLQGDIRTTTEKVKGQEDKNKILIKQNGEFGKKLEVQRKDFTALNKDFEKLKIEEAKLKVASRRFQEEARTKQAKVQSLEVGINKSEQELKMVNSKLATADANLRQAQDLQKKIGQDNSALNSQNLKLTQENIKLDTSTNQLRTAFNDLKSRADGLSADIATLTKARNTATTELLRSQTDLQKVNAELQRTLTDLKSAQADRTMLFNITQNTRTQPMIFRFQEEVARLSVEPRMNVQKSSAALTTLIRAARLRAESKGAKENRTLGFPSAGVFAHQDPKTGNNISPREIENGILQRISGSGERI